jgi:hypothetical protein
MCISFIHQKSNHIPLATPSSAESATTEKIIFIVGYVFAALLRQRRKMSGLMIEMALSCLGSGARPFHGLEEYCVPK